MSKSRTRDALDYMKKTGCTAYVAAQKFGITPATVYAASRKVRCPHCGNFLKGAEPAEPKNTRVLTEDRPDADDLLSV